MHERRSNMKKEERGILNLIDEVRETNGGLQVETNLSYKGRKIKIATLNNLPGRNIVGCGVTVLEPDCSLSYRICLDDWFFKLDDELKLFIIYHEVGHIMSGHLSLTPTAIGRILYNNIKRIIGFKSELEIEADRYCYNVFRKYGGMKKREFKSLIRRLYEECKNLGLNINSADILVRYRAVNNY